MPDVIGLDAAIRQMSVEAIEIEHLGSDLQRVAVPGPGGVAVLLAGPHDLGQIFDVHLVANAGARRHRAEVLQLLLAPAEELVALAVALVLEVDVARIGGITPWLKVAHLAETFNMAVCPHFLMELHVALCCAIPNSRWVEYIPQLDTLTTKGMAIIDGHAVPSSDPGLGIAWNFDEIARCAVAGSTRVIK